MTNWKTTLAGLVTGLPIAIDALIKAYSEGAFSEKSGLQLVAAIGIVIFGLLTKDHDTTGGTRSNVPNDASVVKEATKIDKSV